MLSVMERSGMKSKNARKEIPLGDSSSYSLDEAYEEIIRLCLLSEINDEIRIIVIVLEGKSLTE